MQIIVMVATELDRQIKYVVKILVFYFSSKPKTFRGRKFLEYRAPKIYENDKQTLIIKGATTSEIVNNFLTDLVSISSNL